MSASHDDQFYRDQARKWLRRGLALAAAVLIIFAGWRAWIAHKVTASIAALRQEGYPVGLVEAQQFYYGAVPGEDNAAVGFLAALDKLRPVSPLLIGARFWTGSRLGRMSPLTEADRARIGADLSNNAEALALLRHVQERKSSRYPLDLTRGRQLTMPHISKIITATKLLALDAALAGESNDTARATEDLEAGLRLAESLRDEPLMLSFQTGVGCRTTLASALERLLNHAPLTEPQLARLARGFADSTNSAAMEHVLAVDLARGADFFSLPAEERNNLAGLRQGAELENTRLIKVAGFFDRDFSFYLGLMKERLRVSRLPFPEQVEAGNQLDNFLGAMEHGKLTEYSSQFLADAVGAHNRAAENVARMSIVQAALAVERYRAAHQDQLPGSLNDLTPAWLPVTPIDPFDGQPLRYKKRDPGYIIYSVGKDRKDDGGTERMTNRSTAAEDIVFSVGR